MTTGTMTERRQPLLPPGRYVELPGRGRTFVREQPGPEGAPVVVLLHGWTATAALNWASSFTPLADHFRVIALDHRGHGRGLRGHAPFRLEDCADDVAALLGELGVGRCIAVGYSMGGPIAQLLWRRHPTLIDGLVLCATAAKFSGTPRELVLSGMASGGSILAGVVPTRPITRAALHVCRTWGRLCGSTWWGFEEIAGHDWADIVAAGRAICRFDSRPWLGSHGGADDGDRDGGRRHRPPSTSSWLSPGRSRARRCESWPAVTVPACVSERFVPALLDACHEIAGRAVHSRARLGDAA